MGPTASGKTEWAVRLVESLPCEIISVDSALVYRGMDIGTAKPGPELLERAPHRLIDILDPAEAYSAARFREDALIEMADIVKNGKIPLLVGGTMLYFRALERGLSEMPSADPRVRERIEALAEREGWGAVHARLAAVDPASAARIHPNDPQRLQRALEVFELTGRPLSAYHKEQAEAGLPYHLLKLALIPRDREAMRERIARRFAKMIEQGLIREVQALYERGDLNACMPSMRAVGYRQVWDYLEGRLERSQMEERAVIATRQLAKRQMTWLRTERNVEAFPAEDCTFEALIKACRAFLDKNG